MIDVHGPHGTLTVQLPAALVEELKILATERSLSVDEVVMEACLAYTEPHYWERCYQEWRRDHPQDA